MRFPFPSFALLALLAFGVSLPIVTQATDSLGGICSCTYQDYDYDFELHRSTLFNSAAVKELDSSYATSDASTCASACATAISSPDRLTSSSYLAAPTNAPAPEVPEKEIKYYLPRLNIDIPGVSFSDITEEGGVLYVKTLPEYISAVYRYALGIAAIFAVVMIMIGGAQYIIGSGTGGEAVDAAKQRITNAVTGLVLVLAAFVVLYVVNPNLTSFQALEIQTIAEAQFLIPEDGEDDNVLTSVTAAPEGTSHPEHKNDQGITTVSASDSVYVNDVLLSDLYTAADSLYDALGKGVVITSGYRTPENQLRIMWNKCFAGSRDGVCDVTVCNPLPSTVVSKSSSGGHTVLTRQGAMATYDEEQFVTAAKKYANASACPHTSSVAVDMWCSESGGNYIFNTACQDKLTEYMQGHNFCRLVAEPWHFEYNDYHVSSACSTSGGVKGQFTTGGKTYSYAGCAIYDAKNKKCVSQ